MSTRLPDFLNWPDLNGLRRRMGAPLAEPFATKFEHEPLELPIEERLRTSGIDVDADEIIALPDGTLGYRGRRVLVYIRDVHVMASRDVLPKYHFAYCQTLDSMHRRNRGGRYVVANSDKGLFEVNLLQSRAKRKEMVALSVCQNCLDHISWDGFDRTMDSPTRAARVRGFALPEFFKKFPRDLLTVRPRHLSTDAPLNDYPADWGRISNRVRRERGYRCEKCWVDLKANLRFLHVHHRNGQRNDNHDRNLQVLCIGCHAEQPLHGHMRKHRDFLEYSRVRGS